MSRGNMVWGALFAAGVAYEVCAIKAKRYDDTLSRTTRRAMLLDTPAGRVIFTTGWCWFSGWFLRHVFEFGDEE